MASFQAVAYEYAVEMTYPLPEGTSAGLINVGSQVCLLYYCMGVHHCVWFCTQVISIVVISFVGHFADRSVNKVPVGLWFMVGVAGLACVLTVFVRPELRRVKIDKKSI